MNSPVVGFIADYTPQYMTDGDVYDFAEWAYPQDDEES